MTGSRNSLTDYLNAASETRQDDGAMTFDKE